MSIATNNDRLKRFVVLSAGLALLGGAAATPEVAHAGTAGSDDTTVGSITGLVVQYPYPSGVVEVSIDSVSADGYEALVSVDPLSTEPFLFPAVPPGDYDLNATVPLANVSPASASVTVVAGEVADVGTLTLYSGFELPPAYSGGVAAIEGSPVVGETLTGSATGFSPPAATVSYQWSITDGAVAQDIVGATGQSLLLTTDMVGRLITLTATASGGGFVPAVVSATTGMVTAPPSPAPAPPQGPTPAAPNTLAATGSEPEAALAAGALLLMLGSSILLARWRLHRAARVRASRSVKDMTYEFESARFPDRPVRKSLGAGLAVALVIGICGFGAVAPASAATVQPDANGQVTVAAGDVLVVKEGQNVKIIVLNTDATPTFNSIPYAFEEMQPSSVLDNEGGTIGSALTGPILQDAYLQMSLGPFYCGGSYGGLPLCGRNVQWTSVPNPAASSNADLAALTLDTPDLAPLFDSAELSYTGNVPYTTSTTVITPTLSDPAAAVTINGTATASGTSSSVALAEGVNTISVFVTAANGATKTYTISVTRAPAPAPPSWTDAALAGIQVSIPYEDAVDATGAAPIAYSVVAGTLPAGLVLDPASGAVSGTPTTAGAYAFTIQAANAVAAITQAFSGVVRAKPVVDLIAGFQPGDDAAGSSLTISGADLPDGSSVSVVLSPTITLYSSVITGSDGTVLALVTLPPGMAVGSHEVRLASVAPGGATASSNIWFSVLADGRVGSVSRFPPLGAVPVPAPAITTTAPSGVATQIALAATTAPSGVATPRALAATGVEASIGLVAIPFAILGLGVFLVARGRGRYDADARALQLDQVGVGSVQ